MVYLPPAPDGQTLHALYAVTTHLSLLKVRLGEHLDAVDALLWSPIVTNTPHAGACHDVARDRARLDTGYRGAIDTFTQALARFHTTRTQTVNRGPR